MSHHIIKFDLKETRNETTYEKICIVKVDDLSTFLLFYFFIRFVNRAHFATNAYNLYFITVHIFSLNLKFTMS